LIGFDLHGKKVGIIGTGKIGSAFANNVWFFGCSIIAYDPLENEELKEQIDIRYTTLEEVCINSDVSRSLSTEQRNNICSIKHFLPNEKRSYLH
jgi:lactate dehydrogenase-like 2-hydroxyacid dehydrogenase